MNDTSSPLNITLQATRGLEWPNTKQLPQEDAEFIDSLQGFLETMPGDAVVIYNATNGDRVTIRAVQADRTLFQVPNGVTGAPQLVPTIPLLALDPDSVNALATALVDGAQTLAAAALTATPATPANPAPALQ